MSDTTIDATQYSLFAFVMCLLLYKLNKGDKSDVALASHLLIHYNNGIDFLVKPLEMRMIKIPENIPC